MRLIDADALKKHYAWWEDDRQKLFDSIVDSQPTVNAVPVVRCKDCKWYYRGGATCMFWDGANGMCGDDFCGKAERKEE